MQYHRKDLIAVRNIHRQLIRTPEYGAADRAFVDV
jgi:hypothetical protein